MVDNQYWSTLFLYKNAVYLLGTTSNGFVSKSGVGISRSADDGYTWHSQVPPPPPPSFLACSPACHLPANVPNSRVMS